ncbi:DUF1161 domain-containing protein [uncultured Pseudomonas sp.]|uniref:DUF1161 domain-containing protein n=1 Tax=uncultured Pseudomonas sp. TaxID=114707 RepID=UPI0025E6D544|nr:DUF1161 domain-containing protein [uncultured Pseudomonas sp.]
MKGCTAVLLALGVLSSNAWATPKSCEELKKEVELKIQAAGVSSYTLEIVPSDQKVDARVIGTCDGGSRKLVYQRTDLIGSQIM